MALQEEMESQGNFLFRHRGTFPIILLVVGFYLYLQPRIHPFKGCIFVPSLTSDDVYLYFCLLVALFGLLIRIYTVGYTPANTSGRNTTGQLADELNHTGIYSTVRHPLYLGNFFMWFGAALLTGNLWFLIAFIFIYWVYYERIMFAEEQFLRKKFGTAYTNWASQTPAIIPSFKKFIKPSLPFSWKKVLKKEKNGLVAVFLIFFLFYASGRAVSGEKIENGFLLWSCVASIVIYFILKYLKNNTKVLDEQGR
jgi:protein-S-isoprenylcysteine O-methyltransferase Ste14